jgi:hypothetical protein
LSEFGWVKWPCQAEYLRQCSERIEVRGYLVNVHSLRRLEFFPGSVKLEESTGKVGSLANKFEEG